MPKGAEAALWSILEAVPDPRHHLALTRDLSGEVRITDRDRANAAALLDVREVDVSEIDGCEIESPAMDPYYDLGAIEENADLTSDLFMADST